MIHEQKVAAVQLTGAWIPRIKTSLLQMNRLVFTRHLNAPFLLTIFHVDLIGG